MKDEMFCFQCEQAGKGGCTDKGVCGKDAGLALEQDRLTGELIGLARAADASPLADSTVQLLIDGLVATATNVSFDQAAIGRLIDAVQAEKSRLVPQCEPCEEPCGRNDAYDMQALWTADEDLRSLKSLILYGLRGMAAYAHHARILGQSDPEVDAFFVKGLVAVGDDQPADELLALALELGQANLACMAMLDAANTGAYGDPEPTTVSSIIEPGPFIVISGHDLYLLEQLLEQTAGSGVAVYTHGEMLPAHAYPGLRRHAHLKGNFGTAWQNQQREFDAIPAAVLLTTNCLMPPKPSYADRVFTTLNVSYPGLPHVAAEDGKPDFTPLIAKAIELGGYPEAQAMPGINGGTSLTCGFARNTVLSAAGAVVEAVKAGQIGHFFLVGGCDGAKSSRSYYTDFVKLTPPDSVILTLACGKYRFNDLDLGEAAGLPRLMDMGQCNDAFSAIQVALALADAFGCGVNELPLTLVLSWYEQKAVAILLTLLALGIQGILIGPSLPEFVSPNILQALVDGYALTPISTPEQDLARILG